MATFVLVHGAWHGAWCWREVVMRLEAHGHQVHALDLPGHGADPTPLSAISLASYTGCIAEVLEKLEEPAVLAGHSLGGLSITDVVGQCAEQIHRLVYLAAFVPQPSFDLFEAIVGGELIEATELDAEAGRVRLRPRASEAAFYANCSESDILYARQRLCDEAVAPMLGEVKVAPAWNALVRHYIECTEDQAIPIRSQRQMHEPFDFNVHTLATDHSPFFSAPDLLVEILEQAAE